MSVAKKKNVDVKTKNVSNDAKFCDADDVDSLCRQKNDANADADFDEYAEKRKKYPNCRKFRSSDFDSSSPSIFYMESRCRQS